VAGMADPRAGAAADDGPRPPRAVAIAWGLLAVNVLGFYDKPGVLLPLPRPAAQVVTMGALVTAFALALAVNRRVRLRASAYLLHLSLLAVLATASSLRLESGTGALFRCFRLVVFVATLWLLSCWWRGGVRFVRYHVRTVAAILLTVAVGMIVVPGAAFAEVNGGRLSGAVWPIPPPQVGLYAALAVGLTVLLWQARRIDGRGAAAVAVPALALLLLSHTRTALLGLVVGLAVASLSVAFTNARARRSIATVATLGVLGAAAFGSAVQEWLSRGQDSDQLASLTGRQRVWDALLARNRTLDEQLFGLGLTDKSFDGLAIDSTWLSVYNELGWAGVVLVGSMLVGLVFTAALRPPTPGRTCAVFLVTYCLVASYTEVGLGDSSPYLLALAVAAAALAVPGPAGTHQNAVAPRWSDQVGPAGARPRAGGAGT
jgi:hypothetical protein